jgi:hypothetical protein
MKHEPQHFAAQGIALHGSIPPKRPESERFSREAVRAILARSWS